MSHDRSVLLGPFARGHLGDALCLSPLVRPLAEEGLAVRLADRPAHRAVFAHHPWVSGFGAGPGLCPHRRLRGGGHVIQRLQSGFGLPVDPVPGPELFLGAEQRHWAADQRAHWPAHRPVCLLATRAVTDTAGLDTAPWALLAAAWARHATLVQAVLSRPGPYERQLGPLTSAERSRWKAGPLLPGAWIYRDLDVGRYLALASAADFYCGPPSGGSHLAAAFDRRALILLPRRLHPAGRFPVMGRRLSVHTFLYPQHRFLALEQRDPARIQAAVAACVAETPQQARQRGALPPGAPSAGPLQTRPRLRRPLRCGAGG